MTALEYLLDGLEAELELERELGVRAVELDRALLSSPPSSSTPPLPHSSTPSLSFAFLHDRPLSPNGIEMMAKIVTAMHQTPESAPIVFTGEKPQAKMYVVLGSEAMKKWYPGMRGSPGQWLRGRNGEDVLVTYSPEYILRFGAVTSELTKLKRNMWTSLKGVMQRIGYSK